MGAVRVDNVDALGEIDAIGGLGKCLANGFGVIVDAVALCKKGGLFDVCARLRANRTGRKRKAKNSRQRREEGTKKRNCFLKMEILMFESRH